MDQYTNEFTPRRRVRSWYSYRGRRDILISYPSSALALRCASMELQRTLNGALAGAAAAAAWAAQQPLDKRVFGSRYDDVELLGKLVTRGPAWPAAGLGLHVANGAMFGAVYALAGRSCRGRRSWPAWPRAWPSTSASGRSASWSTATTRPATSSSRLRGNRRAFAQATWRHFLFGVVLAEFERRLNAKGEFEPLEDVPVVSNGHGNIEQAAVGATEAAE